MHETCVIIGGGHAGASLAPALRQEGWQGRILVVTDEAYLPYHRPPLSKALLAGEKQLEDIYIRPLPVFTRDGVEFRLHSRVARIAREHRQLELVDGHRIAYDKLVLTTGSRVRKLDLPGIGLEGICYLRSYQDVEQIRQRIVPGRKAVIVGGGYIGLETATVLQKAGMEVTVLETMHSILQRVTAPEVAGFFTRLHSEEGVRIVCDTDISVFEGDASVQRVVCADSSNYPADLVIIGVGIVPNVELAADAGLKVDNGIVVDVYTRTEDPHIFAAGDCTNHYSALYDRYIRLESVQNATDQARIAAASLCGRDKIYDALPWFWSDQYDVKLQIAGLSQGYDQVVIRGDTGKGRQFTAFYLQHNVVIAVDAINKPADFMLGKRLISDRIVVDRDLLADTEISLKSLLN
jgi:3-phenylpropionate/trans-cinnamate dioxygenase ferredoxin reductase subunit